MKNGKKKSPNSPHPDRFRYYAVLSAIIALALYLPTVNYEYTLDDGMYIMRNSLTQGGIQNIKAIFTTGSIHDFNTDKGPEPWRPMAITSFAFGKSLWNNLPAIEHLINALLYAFSAFFLFRVLQILFPGATPIMTLLAVMLFATHPVHTEVVANIKSRDELMFLLLGLITWWVHLANSSINYRLISALLFLAALLSKETAIVFVAIIPLADYLLRRKPITETIKGIIPMFMATLLFLFFRHAVVGGAFEAATGDPVNNILYAASGFSEYWGTAVYLLGFYFAKLLWPIPLLHDYSLYDIWIKDFGEPMVWMVIAAYLLTIITFFKTLRARPGIALGIFIFFAGIAPVGNVFFLNGASFAERFLYLPSMGICSFAVLGFIEKKPSNKILQYGLMALCGIFILISLERMPDWKNNEALFESGAQSAPDNARIRASLAFDYKERAFASKNPRQQTLYFQKAEREFLAALELYPQFHYTTYNLGVMYYETGQKEKAQRIYEEGVKRFPKHRDMHNNLGVILFERKSYNEASVYFKKALLLDSLDANALANVGACYQNTGTPDSAEFYYLKCLLVNPKHNGALGNLAIIYRNRGNPEKADYYESQKNR
jgi:tetratricopeptide (TPR) repeat protein